MLLRIRELRTAANLTQTQLASSMGVGQSTVVQWEQEIALPRVRQLPLLAHRLGVPIGELFTEDACNMEAFEAIC